MTPSQTQDLLQEVKDEVAKKHGYVSWFNLTNENQAPDQYIDEVAELYHTRLLAEAGKELNTVIKSQQVRIGYNICKVEASALLAAKQGEIDRLNKEVVSFQMMAQSAFKVGLDALTEETTKRMESDSMFSMVVAKLSYQVKENESLKSQLEEAQKEKGDMKFGLEDLLEWLNKEIEIHSFKESQDKGKWIAERRDTIEATLLVVKHKIEANLAPKEHSEGEYVTCEDCLGNGKVIILSEYGEVTIKCESCKGTGRVTLNP